MIPKIAITIEIDAIAGIKAASPQRIKNTPNSKKPIFFVKVI